MEDSFGVAAPYVANDMIEKRLLITSSIVPALILGCGMIFMPHSPRWLVSRGREDEALNVLTRVRALAPGSEIVQLEFLYVFLFSV